MSDTSTQDGAWLVAGWPGMGNVAVIAAGYIVRQLRLKESGELPSHDHFEIQEIVVKKGLIERARLPRGVFFRDPSAAHERDLVVFLGEAQPTTGTFTYADALLEAVSGMNVKRVVTFASMASAIHPADDPKVAGIATDSSMLAALRRAEVEPLGEGQIGGLNGVLLAAAQRRNIPGLCLLAEIPFFAAGAPNPKAARVALSVFGVLSGIEISLDELNKHAAQVDHALIEAYERLKAEGALTEEPAEEGEPPGHSAEATEEPAGEGRLGYAARVRIERLFEEARKDSTKAFALKQELDRLGVFKQYEDRFLDLFRRAG